MYGYDTIIQTVYRLPEYADFFIKMLKRVVIFIYKLLPCYMYLEQGQAHLTFSIA
jgi:hypothetical protein